MSLDELLLGKWLVERLSTFESLLDDLLFGRLLDELLL